MPSKHTPDNVSLDRPQGAEELARVVRAQVGSKHSSMTLRLDPPELGRVRVDVRMHNDIMSVRFQADSQAGHDAIQGRLRELTGALEQQGVRLDRVEVEFRPPPPPEPQRDEQQPAQQQADPGWSEPQSHQRRHEPDYAANGDRPQAWWSQPETAATAEPAAWGGAIEQTRESGVDLVV